MRRATNLINLAESCWRRTDRTKHCERKPPHGSPNRKLPCDFFRRTSPPRTSNSWCPLLNFLRLLRGRLIGRTPDFESGYRGSSPRPGAKLLEPLRTEHFYKSTFLISISARPTVSVPPTVDYEWEIKWLGIAQLVFSASAQDAKQRTIKATCGLVTPA
jgi:hypothetical protein